MTDSDRQERLEALREVIRVGTESGPGIPAEEVFALMLAKASGIVRETAEWDLSGMRQGDDRAPKGLNRE
jgi:hypothetical protein